MCNLRLVEVPRERSKRVHCRWQRQLSFRVIAFDTKSTLGTPNMDILRIVEERDFREKWGTQRFEVVGLLFANHNRRAIPYFEKLTINARTSPRAPKWSSPKMYLSIILLTSLGINPSSVWGQSFCKFLFQCTSSLLSLQGTVTSKKVDFPQSDSRSYRLINILNST